MTVQDLGKSAGSSADRAPEIIEGGGTARLHLALATADYDHVRDLTNGLVRADGIVLTGFTLPIEEVFYRFIKNREWDVSEMSFGKFIAYASQGNSPFIGIPVFPSRVFRHSSFYVRADRGIASAKDLEGKTVGIPEWAQTAGIYARGFLAETEGVDLRKIRWVQAGINEAGREEKVEFKLPPGIQYEQRRDTSLSAMLLSGEVDAAMSARVPDAFKTGGGRIVRLFPNYREEEARYHAATGIFPIMHVVVVRRDVYDRHPWVVQSLYKALLAAKQEAYQRLYDTSALRFMLPWLIPQLEEARSLLGPDFWSYGLAGNGETLATFLRYHHEQGLSRRLWKPAELFAPESMESAVI
jgi:4,5-dihydroxyphthalate decarboxylase